MYLIVNRIITVINNSARLFTTKIWVRFVSIYLAIDTYQIKLKIQSYGMSSYK